MGTPIFRVSGDHFLILKSKFICVPVRCPLRKRCRRFALPPHTKVLHILVSGLAQPRAFFGWLGGLGAYGAWSFELVTALNRPWKKLPGASSPRERPCI